MINVIASETVAVSADQTADNPPATAQHPLVHVGKKPKADEVVRAVSIACCELGDIAVPHYWHRLIARE